MTELGPEARAILDAGRAGDDPTPADRDRLRGAVFRAVAAGAAATAASTATEVAAAMAPKGAVFFSVGWKVVVGVLVAGAVYVGVGGPIPGRHGDDQPRLATTAAPAPDPKAAEPSTPPPAEPPAAVPATPPVEPTPATVTMGGDPPYPPPQSIEPPKAVAAREAAKASAAPPSTGPATAGPASSPPASATADPLVVETVRLGEAQGVLEKGDPARALAMIDEQSATYQNGKLREEREAARIFALCKLGRTAEAESARAAFLREHPHAPLVDRVRAACGASARP
jgi:hypothetical protein